MYRYLPKTNAILEEKPITIISARTIYGEEFPGDYGRWKIEAFKSILKKINTDVQVNECLVTDKYDLYGRLEHRNRGGSLPGEVVREGSGENGEISREPSA